MTQAALAHVERLPQLFQSLQDVFRRHDPIGLICSLTFYALQRFLKSDGSMSGSGQGVGQHHVELLQAVLLTVPEDEWGAEPTVPNAVKELFDTLPPTSDVFLAQRIAAAKEWPSPQERTVAALQERVRFHTHAVRNWGYFGASTEIALEIYSGLDQSFLDHHGFAARDVVRLAKVMVAELERRANVWVRAMSHVAKAGSIDEMLARYLNAFPDMAGTPESLRKAIPADVPLRQVHAMLMGHADLRHVDACTFEPDQLAELLDLTPERIEAALRALSLRPGALVGQRLDHAFLSNPIWAAPGIMVEDRFVFPMPQAIMSHIHPIMRRLAVEANAATQLEAARAGYLERRLVDTLRRALPGADVRAAVTWTVGDQRFETDAAAVLDKVMVIAEAKAHHLTPEGLRGAPDRVKRHVRDLVINPSVQSARLESVLRNAQAGEPEALGAMAQFGVADPNLIERVIRLSVSLDDLSVIASAEPELRQAGWIPDDHELAPMMNVADLMVLAEILDEPIDFLHYLAERGPFQRAFELLGDELDFLGLYLETGFNLGDTPPELRFSPSGMSAVVDRFYDARDAGLSVPKPGPARSRTFAATVRMLSDRRRTGWTLMGMHLLNAADPSEQVRLEQMLQKARKGVRRKAPGLRDGAIVQVTPALSRKAPVAFLVHDHVDRDELKTAIEGVAAGLLDGGAAECVVLARHIDRWEEPYQIACIAKSHGEEIGEGPA